MLNNAFTTYHLVLFIFRNARKLVVLLKRSSHQSPMTTYKDTGIIERAVPKKTYEEELFEWRIPDFSTVIETKDPGTCYDSPTFIVCDVSWFLRLCPSLGSNLDDLRVYIRTSEKREYSLKYNFSLKILDGSTEQLACGILEGNRTSSNTHYLIKRSEICRRKSDLIPEDILTLVCRLKYEITHCTQPIASGKTKTPKFISK